MWGKISNMIENNKPKNGIIKILYKWYSFIYISMNGDIMLSLFFIWKCKLKYTLFMFRTKFHILIFFVLFNIFGIKIAVLRGYFKFPSIIGYWYEYNYLICGLNVFHEH